MEKVRPQGQKKIKSPNLKNRAKKTENFRSPSGTVQGRTEKVVKSSHWEKQGPPKKKKAEKGCVKKAPLEEKRAQNKNTRGTAFLFYPKKVRP